jgi:acyl-CoA dehydrogenase
VGPLAAMLDAAGDPFADSEERALLRATLRRMIGEVSPPDRIRRLDEAEAFDDELHVRLGELGILALGGPESEGGSGDVRDQLVALEELAAGPTSMAAFVVVHYMALQLLGHFGSDGQRTVLRDLLAGRAKAAFALTEAGGGTDIARAMRTRAAPDGDGWRIRGQKLWISGADRADHLLVLARTAGVGEGSVDGITTFVVPRAAEGLGVRTLDTLGVHGLSTCEVTFDDVAVGPEAVLGDVDRGFRQVLGTLNNERLHVAAGAIGAGRAALETALDHARERQAFGRAIGGFQAIQHRLVDGVIALEAARGLVLRAAEVEATGGRADVLSSMAKVAATEAATRVTQDGLHVLGGMGFSRELPMQRWFRDVRLWTFAPLTNEMLRNHIGERLLGLPRSF